MTKLEELERTFALNDVEERKLRRARLCSQPPTWFEDEKNNVAHVTVGLPVSNWHKKVARNSLAAHVVHTKRRVVESFSGEMKLKDTEGTEHLVWVIGARLEAAA